MNGKFLKIFIGVLFIFIISLISVLIIKNLQNNDPNFIIIYTKEEKTEIKSLIINRNITEYEKYVNDGASLSFAFDDNTTPLEALIYANDILNAEKVINSGFDLTKIDNNHIDTVSNILVYNMDFDISAVDNVALELVEQIKDEIENEDSYGYSLLMNAIYTNNFKLVKEIIKYIEDIDKIYHNETALTFACSHGTVDIEIIKLILDKGADVNFQGSNGYNCLMYLVSNHQDDILSYIIENKNVNINTQNELGQTVMHIAVEYYNLSAVDIIRQNTNINLSIKDNDDYTAKEYAQYLGFNDIAIKF